MAYQNVTNADLGIARFDGSQWTQTIIDSAEGIRDRMKPELRNDWEYMPRTREMSAGKRALLLRWLDLVSP